MIIHMGIDDTDSPKGGCTTHLGYTIVKQIWNDVEFLDYPNLIRLNPNIPYRTRGNGAVALRFITKNPDRIKEKIIHIFDTYYDKNYKNTNPGLVFVENNIPEQIKWFSRKALEEVIPVKLARNLIERLNLEYYGYGKMRGLIGGLSAIGNQLKGDYTYELITYRDIKEHDRVRNVDFNSVVKIDKKYHNYIFANIDYKTHTLLITPHGPDPVIYGIRGEDPEILVNAMHEIISTPPISSWMIFRSNQGTGEHLKKIKPITEARPYRPHIAEGIIKATPRIIEGGHVNFLLEDNTGTIECMAYEPSGDFRKIIMQLTKNDFVRIYGGIKPASSNHPITLNVERLDILYLAKKYKYQNPICPKCGKRLKSAGSNKGYKCKNCGFRIKEIQKIKVPIERNVKVGIYIPPPRAQRHLTRPIERLSRNNESVLVKIIEKWFE